MTTTKRTIAGDDRGRSCVAELVGEAAGDPRLRHALPKEEAGDQDGSVVERAEVAVATLDARKPIVGEGVFDAAADRQACTARGERVRKRRCEQEVLTQPERLEGNAARGVDHEAVEGDTDTAADRSLDTRAPIGVVEQERVERSVHTHAGAQHVAFDTEDELVDLPVEAGMAAADRATGAEVQLIGGETAGDAGLADVLPAVAAIDADIEPGPGEERNDRQDRGRPAGWKVGGESRADHRRRSRGRQKKFAKHWSSPLRTR